VNIKAAESMRDEQAASLIEDLAQIERNLTWLKLNSGFLMRFMICAAIYDRNNIFQIMTS